MQPLSPQQLKDFDLDTLVDEMSKHIFKNTLTELLNGLSDAEVEQFKATILNKDAKDFTALANQIARQYPTFLPLLEKHHLAFVDACVTELEKSTPQA